MYRGTNPVLTLELPKPVTIVSLFITFQQDDRTVLEKTLDDVEYDEYTGVIRLQLSQEDTLALVEGETRVQLRLRDSFDNVIASDPMRIMVGEVFKEGVI